MEQIYFSILLHRGTIINAGYSIENKHKTLKDGEKADPPVTLVSAEQLISEFPRISSCLIYHRRSAKEGGSHK